MSGIPEKIEEAKKLIACKICNMASLTMSPNDFACEICRKELKTNTKPVMQAGLHPGNPLDALPMNQLHVGSRALMQPASALSPFIGTHSASNAILLAGAAYQSQATSMGGRLAQTVNYIQPSTRTPNLEAAHRFKSLAKQSPQQVPRLQSLYPMNQAVEPMVTYFVTMRLGVFPLQRKPGRIPKRVNLTDLEDAGNFFKETADTCFVFHALIDQIRAEYNKVHRNAYGIFPLFSDASFEVEVKRKTDGPITLRYEWMDGSLGRLMSYLSKFGIKDRVIVRLVWRQEPSDESVGAEEIKGGDNDNDDDPVANEGTDSEDGGIDCGAASHRGKKAERVISTVLQKTFEPEVDKGDTNAEVEEADLPQIETSPAINTVNNEKDDSFANSGDAFADPDHINHEYLKPSARCGGTSATSSGSAKRTRGDFSNEELDKEASSAHSRQPSPLPVPVVSLPEISYTPRKMKTIITCTIDQNGKVHTLEQGAEDGKDKILIANNWVNELYNGDDELGAKGALLGTGGYKSAIRALMSDTGKAMCVLVTTNNEAMTEANNFHNLISELRAIAIGQFLLKSWYKRGKRVGYALPAGIRFNAEGAFIGKLDADENPDCGQECLPACADTEGCCDGGLPFLYFLAVPLLCIDEDHVEQRYIPTSGIGHNQTVFEEVMNSFVHYAFEASARHFVFADLQGVRQPDGGCILIDPQCHFVHELPAAKKRATWDDGVTAGERLKANHICGPTCEGLRIPSF